MTNLSSEFWRKCSSCKAEIGYVKKYYVCSVSTCNRKRIGYVFCSVHCWERHLPGARHRDAAAIESVSLSFAQWSKEIAEDDSNPTAETQVTSVASPPKRVFATASNPSQSLKPAPPTEILVVVSKLKSYIRERSDMNTSDSVMDTLSKRLREMCDDAIEKAREAGRKTVMDRDFE